MKKNGIIIPDVQYDVPEHTSIHTEKIAYFFSLEEAREFCTIVDGTLTEFTAQVLIEGEHYSASVKYIVDEQ